MESGIAERSYRHSSEDVRPWNARFARELPEELPEDSPSAAREVLAAKDARTLARELSGATRPAFSAAFRGSPTERAKLRGLERNAAAALGNGGTADDVDVLTRALDDGEPLVREHAASALRRLDGDRDASPALSDAGGSEARRGSAVRR